MTNSTKRDSFSSARKISSRSDKSHITINVENLGDSINEKSKMESLEDRKISSRSDKSHITINVENLEDSMETQP